MSATLQLHLLLAHSHLDHLSSHLRPHLLQRSSVGGALNPSLLLLNNTGVLVGGVLESMVEVRPPPNKEPTPEGTAGGYTQQRVDLTDCIHVKCPYNGAGTYVLVWPATTIFLSKRLPSSPHPGRLVGRS